MATRAQFFPYSTMAPATRLATSDDILVLLDLMQEFYAEANFLLDRTEAAESFRLLLENPVRGNVWLLLHDGTPAGYVVLTVGFSMEYGGLAAFVDDLFVKDKFRRLGLGRAGLNALFTECKRRGVRALHLEVGRDNTHAKALYAQFGFRETDRQLLSVRLSGATPAS